jgi:hypothetical protein
MTHNTEKVLNAVGFMEPKSKANVLSLSNALAEVIKDNEAFRARRHAEREVYKER